MIEEYIPQWTSLRKHQTPDWLTDAKFGIYCHFGLASAYYQELMDNPKITLRESIPSFKAKDFDADAWADLFARAGAQFAGPTAWHGSGFVNWKSSKTKWNSVDLGPGKDFVGELSHAIRERGMKFITSFHTGHWYAFPHWEGDSEYTNPDFAGLYGPVHDTDVTGDMSYQTKFEKQQKMSEEFMSSWYEIITEAIDKYSPDIVWYDCGFGGSLRAHNRGFYRGGRLISRAENYISGFQERYGQRFISHFYNHARKQNQDVEFVYKVHDVPPGVGMRNMENGMLPDLQYDPWMTDIDLCKPTSWFYKDGVSFKSPEYIINLIADATSKNGCVLLNVPPTADGTFTDEAQQILGEIGSWLQGNGEAIYGTMPWTTYGEGPTDISIGHYSDKFGETHFTPDDFRFTEKDDVLYAICLGVPASTVNIRALGSRGKLSDGDIAVVEMLGHSGTLKWSHLPSALKIHVPSERRRRHAPVFKITRNRA